MRPLASVAIGTGLLVRVLLAVLGILLIALAARVRIPLGPPAHGPLTLATYAVLVIASAYGTLLGSLTVAGYIVLGLIWRPALGDLELPSGGYALGLVVAALAMGAAAARGQPVPPCRAPGAGMVGHGQHRPP